MSNWIIQQNCRLIDSITDQLGISKNKAKSIVDAKLVFVNNKRVWIATYQLFKNDRIEIFKTDIQEKKTIKIKDIILYEDDYIIAVNKPPFLISDNDPASLENLLRKEIKPAIKAIHRLDKDTSGVILYAKDFNVFEKYKEVWKNQDLKKIYLAFAYHESEFKTLYYDSDIENKKAISLFSLLKNSNGYAYYSIEILTGRKHQIRIHLAKLKHPIIGDKEFGLKTIQDERIKNVTRQMLHSYQLKIICPFTKKNIELQAPLQPDFINFGKSNNLL